MQFFCNMTTKMRKIKKGRLEGSIDMKYTVLLGIE